MRFSRDPLTQQELETTINLSCYSHDTVATEYQYRSLAILGDSFHKYVYRKYPPEKFCVFAVEELQPLFCEIHRAVVYLHSTFGLSVKEALVEFLTPVKGRKVGI